MTPASSPETSGPKGWYWLIAIGLLAWNIIGVTALLFDPALGLGDPSKLPVDQQTLYHARPIWGLAGFVIASVCGLLGSILLLARRAVAKWFFMLSLVGLILQNLWLFLVPQAREMITADLFVLPAVIVLSVVLALWLNGRAVRQGWSR